MAPVYYSQTWQNWTASSTGSSATYIWYEWTASSTSTYLPSVAYNHGGVSVAHVAPTPMTPEEQDRIAASVKEAQTRSEARAQRAKALLLSVLNDEQRRELEEKGVFHVRTRSNLYRIKEGTVRRVDDQGRATISYCIHPTGGFHHHDVSASLKLLLDHDEVVFLKTANATRLAVAA